MQKRTFLLRGTAALMLAGLALGGCTTTTTAGKADSSAVRTEIEQGAYSTLERLYAEVKGSRELVRKSAGVLVFPRVLAAGLVVGGEYGKGVLRTGGQSVDYYSVASVSVGFQAGAQSKAVVLLFMTREALDKFRNSKGWTAGVDGSVALLKVGANGEIDTTTANNPVQALVLTNAGLMANLNLEGTKITKLNL
ncbi:twin-arginine translocation pathway signal [Duganella sp. BJB488]|uniref:BPSL1445 family SYLF domain-containing lipoprotein n=1 Tax=unclassified Duganella TaxID=2636909 RepID=UPI000E357941|nr:MULTISPECIES: YSC84-related protein [unclassified Duganella]NVD72741.1 twin-arginine translocation pathway signal [Duganella sp. BJB1802]RFP20342.1 twin-arginine translocation pathway signal [Duganella sp. BJB489]RFP21214.1 twin-arginine translocation pathway signal [Duganella sp. BJB488]RFP33355.1 twin-arginine translocation pathway signal [Duganella sp. BJB480]